MTVAPAHTFQVIEQIPEADFDSAECCILSRITHAELNESHKIVQYTCHGVNKYLDLDSVVEWIQSPAANRCMQCTATIDGEEIQDLIYQLEELRILNLSTQQEDLQTRAHQLSEELSCLKAPVDIETKAAQLQSHTLPLIRTNIQINELENELIRSDLDSTINEKDIALNQLEQANLNIIDYNYNRLRINCRFDNRISELRDQLSENNAEKMELLDNLKSATTALDELQKYQAYSKVDLLREGSQYVLAAGAFTALSAPVLPVMMTAAAGSMLVGALVETTEPIKHLYHRVRQGL